MELHEFVFTAKGHKRETFYIVGLGDLHYGTESFDEKKLKEIVKWIKARPTTYFVGLGDYCELITFRDLRRFEPSNIDKRFRVSDLQGLLTEQVDRLSDLLSPIRDRCIGLADGNHEYDALKNYDYEATARLCQNLGTRHLGWTSLTRLVFKRGVNKPSKKPDARVLTMLTEHSNLAGRKKGGKVNRLEDRIGDWFDVDIALWGHCFSEDTELLTKEGWKTYRNLKKGEPIYSFNQQNNKIEADTIKNIFEYDKYKHLTRLKSKSIDFLITDNHRIVYRYHAQRQSRPRYNHRWLTNPASYFNNKTFSIQIPSANLSPNDKDFPIDDNWIRLIGWLISEGHFRRHPKAKSGISLYQRQSKAHHIENVLKNCQLDFSKYLCSCKGRRFFLRGREYKSRQNLVTFYIKEHSAKKVRQLITSKSIPGSFASLSNRQFKIFLETMILGDGSRQNKNNTQYYSKDEKLIDDLQLLCFQNGYRTIKTVRRDNNYELQINSRNVIHLSHRNLSKVSYKGKVWCVSTNNGTVVVRRNGRIAIMGNSHDKIALTKEQLYLPKKGKLCLRKRKIVAGIVPSFYKSYQVGTTSYSERRGYSPTSTGILLIEISPWASTSSKESRIELHIAQ